jgi:hypothetical protein
LVTFIWFWVNFPLFGAQKAMNKWCQDFHAATSEEFNFISKFSSNITSLIYVPTKIDCLTLESQIFGDLLHK